MQTPQPAPQPASATLRSDSLFLRSSNPMLIADNARRYVDANTAACLFLRLSHQQVYKLRIDDLTAPHLRPGLEATWSDFLQGRLTEPSKAWELQMPDGASIQVEISGTPHFQPGRHLAVLMFPVAHTLNNRLQHATTPANGVLSNREREILTLVALGHTGVQIAGQLFLSPATVATHVTNALTKLGAKNRAHGITLALQRGELDALM